MKRGGYDLHEGGFKDASVAILLCLNSGHSTPECSVCATMMRFHRTLETSYSQNSFHPLHSTPTYP